MSQKKLKFFEYFLMPYLSKLLIFGLGQNGSGPIYMREFWAKKGHGPSRAAEILSWATARDL